MSNFLAVIVWVLDQHGQVDLLAYDHDEHNGPRCSVCGYGFCHNCKDDVPGCDCPGAAA